MSEARILLVSNGFGEIAILETIARAIRQQDPGAELAHMPLVGRLRPDAWPLPVGPQRQMPSGGLVTNWNFRNIAKDLRAGLVSATIAQFAYLLGRRKHHDAVVAVGDVYCLTACMLFARLPALFVATAKSEYVAPHSGLECRIAARARLVFARDRATADALAKRGVRARYSGNAMMDAVASAEMALPVQDEAMRIAVLPGSRSDASANASAAIRRLKKIAAKSAKPVQAFIAAAPSADADALIAATASEGVPLARTGAQTGIVARGATGALEVLLTREAFAAVLRAGDIVLGQAGTANEQAAGLGKPVVAAADPGETPVGVGWYRMRQQKLLGDALLVLPADDDAFAEEVLRLYGDPARMAAMGAAGRQRMGDAGASPQIAAAILAVARGEA